MNYTSAFKGFLLYVTHSYMFYATRKIRIWLNAYKFCLFFQYYIIWENMITWCLIVCEGLLMTSQHLDTPWTDAELSSSTPEVICRMWRDKTSCKPIYIPTTVYFKGLNLLSSSQIGWFRLTDKQNILVILMYQHKSTQMPGSVHVLFPDFKLTALMHQ